MAETLPVKPADLLIDEENPRISQPNAGQHKAHQALAQHQQRKLQILARSIVHNGLNPSELPIVMAFKDDLNRFVVLEGNRRLAALKALESPDSLVGAVNPGVLADIRRLSREYQKNPVESVPCVVVKDRAEAQYWIQLRHTGENEGAGIVTWGADESARFRARTGASEIHQQALNFLEKRGDLTVAARRMVPTTSLKRLLGTPEVRSRLGLELQRGELCILADPETVAKALLWVANDLVYGTTKVADIYTRPQRIQYANNIPAGVAVTPTVSSGQGMPIKPGSGRVTARSTARAKLGKPRDKLIPRDCTLNIQDARLSRMEIELRKLGLNDYTNAVGVLFRVFVELSVDKYVEGRKLPAVKDPTLRSKLQQVANDLTARKKLTPQQAVPVRRACSKDSFLAPSVTLMHAYVHNPHVFPAPSDLRAHWDSLQPFISAIWAP